MEYIVNLITSLPPRAATLLSVIIGFILIDDLDADEQAVLGAFIINVGNILTTNAVNQEFLEDRAFDKEFEEVKENVEEIEQLKRDIEALRNQIEQINDKKDN